MAEPTRRTLPHPTTPTTVTPLADPSARRAGTRRLAHLAAAVAISAGTMLATTPSTPVSAQDGVKIDGEACTDGTGVTVVVDFQELGDDTVVVRCATGAPADGFAALESAGVPYRTTITFPGFLCRLYEEPADDPCDTTSPADAYWSYWLAPAGGEWCYSNKGAGNRTPPPGSVEGWSFSMDKTSEDVPPPRFAPPAAPDGADAAPLAASDCTTGPADASGQAPEQAGTDDATADGTDTAEETDDQRSVGQGGPVDLDSDTDDGSPIATIVALVAVAALAALAITVAVRRRAPNTDSSTGPPDPAPPSDDVWRRPEHATPATPATAPSSDGSTATAPGPGRDEPLPDVTRWARPDQGGDATLDR